jgi:hypothetical protein
MDSNEISKTHSYSETNFISDINSEIKKRFNSLENMLYITKDYLEKSYNIYTKLIESSSTLAKVKGDKLIPIDLLLVDEEIVITPQANGGFWTRPVEQSTAE